MIALGLSLSLCAAGAGWLTDSAALLILAFWAFLIVFACLLFRDWHHYDHEVNKPLQGQLRIGLAFYDVEDDEAA